jgi:hypothetical protein
LGSGLSGYEGYLMNLYDLFDCWDDVTYERKVAHMKAVIRHLEQPFQKDDDILKEMLKLPLMLESDDYFGTEGLLL